METMPVRDDAFLLPLSLAVSGLGICPPVANPDELDLQPRLCACESSLAGSGGDFGFDNEIRSLRAD